MRIFFLSFFLLIIIACSKTDDTNNASFSATPYTLEIPPNLNGLLPPVIPNNNPLSIEGVALGRKLFYDPILSGNGTQACATCHLAQNSFTDPKKFSIGINGSEGTRNAMPIYNLAWNIENKFFWDGRAIGLEEQAFQPVTNPIEMNNTWPNAVASLQATSYYPELFNNAFGTSTIDSVLVVKAIAQFERTMISANSRFDKFSLGTGTLTPQEENGLAIFLDENRGDCFHCHGNPQSPLWTDNKFHNNGLDAVITDKGLGDVSGDPADNGKFKTPSLRNLAYTAPYMHDGRFATLDEVIDHYSEGLVYSTTIDPLMKTIAEGGVHLTPQDKADLKAFLLSLSDESYLTNPNFQNPN